MVSIYGEFSRIAAATGPISTLQIDDPVHHQLHPHHAAAISKAPDGARLCNPKLNIPVRWPDCPSHWWLMLIVPVIAAWARLDSLAFALDRQSSCPIPFSKLPTFRSRPTRLGLEGSRAGGISVAEVKTMERMAENASTISAAE
jgi:hypothetical protein